MYSYTAYGLTIASELSLPELVTIQLDGEPDVTVRLGPVPETLQNAADRRTRFQAAPGEFLLRIDKAAFYVQNGRQITVDPASDSADTLSGVRVFLLGSAFGALMQQRGILVLHGAFLVIHGKGVLLTGKSTAGKSTLAAALNQRGHAILTDDVCAVTLVDGQVPYAAPGFPSVKLWRDSAEMLCTDISGLSPISEDWQKYRVAVSRYHAAPVRLETLFVLDKHDAQGVRIEPVAVVIDKLNLLIKNTYRHQFLKGLGLKAAHFRQCAAAAGQADVFRALRPKDGCSISALADAVEQTVCGGPR